MTRTLALASVLAALTLSAPGCGGGGSGTDAPLTVEQQLDRFFEAYQAADAAAVAGMCHFPFSLDGVTVDTAAQLQALLETTFQNEGTIETAELVGANIVETGDSAHVTGTFHLVDSTGASSRAVVIEATRYGDAWRATSFAFAE